MQATANISIVATAKATVVMSRGWLKRVAHEELELIEEECSCLKTPIRPRVRAMMPKNYKCSLCDDEHVIYYDAKEPRCYSTDEVLELLRERRGISVDAVE